MIPGGLFVAFCFFSVGRFSFRERRWQCILEGVARMAGDGTEKDTWDGQINIQPVTSLAVIQYDLVLLPRGVIRSGVISCSGLGRLVRLWTRRQIAGLRVAVSARCGWKILSAT